MKIKYSTLKTKEVGKLLKGDLFEYASSVYMITSSPIEYDFRQCIDLETGELYKVDIDKVVMPVEGELLIIKRGNKEEK